jgi:hypothetical protein
MSMVSGIPRKHAHSLQRLYSLAFDFGTFAYAKDQASSPLDGLLGKARHHALMTYLGSSNAHRSRFHREPLTLPYHTLPSPKQSSDALSTKALPAIISQGSITVGCSLAFLKNDLRLVKFMIMLIKCGKCLVVLC